MHRTKYTFLFALVALAFTTQACKPDAKKKTPDTTPKIVVKKVPKKDDKKPVVKKEVAKPADNKGGEVKMAKEGGKWVVSKLYPVKFRVPEDWKIKIEDDGISATDSDDSTTVILVGSESTGMIQGAINDVKKKVNIKDAKFDKTAQTIINGLPGQSIFGTAVITKKADDGKLIDEEIQFIAYNLKVGKKAVTMMIFSEATMYEAKKETIMGLAKTLTKS